MTTADQSARWFGEMQVNDTIQDYFTDEKLADIAFKREFVTPCIDERELPSRLEETRGRAHVCNDQENPVARSIGDKGWLGMKSVDKLSIGHTYIEMRLDSVGGQVNKALPHCYDMRYVSCLHQFSK